jgi:hypothetical protein
MFEMQSETHLGLYVKYSLLTKGIMCRLQILVEHTSIIFNRFYFAPRFMTFRSRLLADIWGRTDGRTDKHGKANSRIQSFRYEDDKGRKKQGYKDSQFKSRIYNDSLPVSSTWEQVIIILIVLSILREHRATTRISSVHDSLPPCLTLDFGSGTAEVFRRIGTNRGLL